MKKLNVLTGITLLLSANAIAASVENNESLITVDDSKKRPNIIVILADDMGYSDLGSFGSEIDTPVLDQLAENGVKMTNFHVGAACSPTRTMLMTGVDNHLAGLGNMLEIQADNQFNKPGYEGHINPDVVTVSSVLKGSGYHTYMVGKWHLGKKSENQPLNRGFERSFTLMESGADNWVNQSYGPMYKKVHYYEDGKATDLPKGEYFSTDYYTDKVISYIESNKGSDQPFFAYVAYQAVHAPHQAPKKYIDKYNGVYDQGWEKLREDRFAKQKEIGLLHKDATLPSYESLDKASLYSVLDWESYSPQEQKFNARRMQTYAGMVDNMDENIGRLMDYLETIGEAENTVIIFMSDNGADATELQDIGLYSSWYEENYQYTHIEDMTDGYPEMGQQGSFSAYGPGWAAASGTPTSFWKTFSSEGGVRSPLIAYYPKGIKAKQSAEFGYIKDIVPTLLEVAKVDITETYSKLPGIHKPSGHSMWNFLTTDSDVIHDENLKIGYELAGSSAVFYGDFKLVRNVAPKGTGEWELYNIITDPAEVFDLAKEKPELLVELIAEYEAYSEKNNLVEVPKGYDPRIQLVKNSMQDSFFIYWAVTIYAWFKGLFA
ncbi:arylsulfatase [Colwelliaceae bacterium BS250]